MLTKCFGLINYELLCDQGGRMKLKKTAFFILVCMFMPSVVIAGTPHYVDCSAAADGNGSYDSPWNNIASVNNHGFNTGDDVYLKAGTTCKANAYLKIDWDGSAVDDVVIGAYYGKGKFGLNGKNRPIIDGQNTLPGVDWTGLIDKTTGTGYVTVENLKVQNSSFHGIQFTGPDNITVKNCHTYRTHRAGITFNYVHTGLIENNTVDTASYNYKPDAAIHAGAGWKDGTTVKIIIRGNTVKNSYEGIGLYKSASYCLVEKNVLYDNRSYQIYNDSGHHNIIRNNIVYRSVSASATPKSAIVVNCEDYNCDRVSSICGSYNAVYHNLITNALNGITLESHCPAYPARGNKVINNTVVDSHAHNFRFYKTGPENEVKSNISWTLSGGSKHVYGSSPQGVTFSNNNYDEDPGGNANDNAVIGDPGLTKTSGWRSILAGEHDEDWWNPRLRSRNKDRGTHLTTVTTTEATANTTMKVNCALFFWNGDYVCVDNNRDGNIDFVARVNDVDKTNHILTLANSHTYTAGGHVYLARFNKEAYFGSQTDIGANEYRIIPVKNLFKIKSSN